MSGVSTVLNFGLGEAKMVDSIRVTWPDQTSQSLQNVPANQRLVINYQPEKNTKNIPVKTVSPLFTKVAPIINYKSEENPINDFKRQLLMLFMYSKTSPVMAKADVNKDGLEDLFVAGDPLSPGKIFTQQADGQFKAMDLPGGEQTATVSAAAFFDANGDGFPDLYLAKGGYALYEPNTPDLQNQLFLNDKKGNFYLAPAPLPAVNASSKSIVRPCDFDGDGDVDLFVGGRVIPGQYPLSPKSYLLVNDGKGNFTSAEIPFANAGMVTDAQWIDLDKDGRKDLVLCGEMMPVKVYLNTKTGFTDQTEKYFDKPTNGFWFSMNFADVDGMGTRI